METATSVEIESDEISYEDKAIGAYLRGEIAFCDLQASLDIGRAHTYRLINRYKRSGTASLESRKKGNRNRAYRLEAKERIMAIVREHFADFGPTLACEKLSTLYRIDVAAETLRAWMRAEGLWRDRHSKKPRIFSPRQPRERRGELVQVDGSYHRWFEKRGPECCLIVFIDDATSELMILRFVDHETSYNYMKCLKHYIEQYGVPRALFSDRHSVFRVNSPSSSKSEPTQFTRACGRLGVKVICAQTPQAKGRVERANRTLQDRLVKEMRLLDISTMEEGNRYLDRYRVEHNERFARPALDPDDAHLPRPNVDLSSLLTYTVERKVFKDLTLSFNKIRFVLDNSDISRRAIGKRVVVAVPLTGPIEILFDETPLPYKSMFDKVRRVDNAQVVDSKRLGAALNMASAINEVEPHHFQRNCHVLAGFRKNFYQPDDIRSRELREAPDFIRRKYNRRPRAPLGQHPIVVLKDRLK
jgi:transposase